MQQNSPFIRTLVLQNKPTGRPWLLHWCQGFDLQERLRVRAPLRQFLIILPCAEHCRQHKMAEAIVL